MSETAVQARIRLALGKLHHVRAFRNNRGLFWAGKPIAKTETTITLEYPRRVEAGLVNGASDLIGWTSVTITPKMVGQKLAVFTSAEVKDQASITADQARWIDAVNAAGGIAGIVRSPEDALRLVGAI